MPTVNLGFISSIATFRPTLSRMQREEALRSCESHVEGGGPAIKDELAAQFASLCDFALKRLLHDRRSVLRTLRADAGYGYAEHHKDWLRLGCDLMVEDVDASDAYSFLIEPSNGGILDSRIEAATREFLERYVSASIFSGISSSFFLLKNPANA